MFLDSRCGWHGNIIYWKNGFFFIEYCNLHSRKYKKVPRTLIGETRERHVIASVSYKHSSTHLQSISIKHWKIGTDKIVLPEILLANSYLEISEEFMIVRNVEYLVTKYYNERGKNIYIIREY